jgi:hypothetical protein
VAGLDAGAGTLAVVAGDADGATAAGSGPFPVQAVMAKRTESMAAARISTGIPREKMDATLLSVGGIDAQAARSIHGFGTQYLRAIRFTSHAQRVRQRCGD